jgi:predicted N-acetyltransferase YhbS
VKKAEKGTRIKVVARGPNKRVLAEDSQGKEVSRVYISPRRVKVGPAGEVVMAGIGGVGTAREHRRRGIASRVYARVMQEMKRSGYSCSGLFTGTVIVAHRMYRRYGFVDISVHRTGRKLLDPKAAVARKELRGTGEAAGPCGLAGRHQGGGAAVRSGLPSAGQGGGEDTRAAAGPGGPVADPV